MVYYKDGGFLTTDRKVLECLRKAKTDGNPLLEKFQIQYPDRTLNEDIYAIHVACVSSENHQSGLDHQTFTDLVEVVITTKQLEYDKAIRVIKGVASEIIRVLKNDDYLGQRLIVRTISPVHSTDTYVLKKGHLLLQFRTEPVEFLDDDDIYNVCHIIADNIEVE